MKTNTTLGCGDQVQVVARVKGSALEQALGGKTGFIMSLLPDPERALVMGDSFCMWLPSHNLQLVPNN